uniref:G-patch domain-containing protein n=1 Tax=Acrobeloides nanus TaxID=290746 RepID=A0A914C533_9BILA
MNSVKHIWNELPAEVATISAPVQATDTKPRSLCDSLNKECDQKSGIQSGILVQDRTAFVMNKAQSDYLRDLEDFEKTCGKNGVVANMMRKMGFEPGKGLGAKNQGILEPIYVDFRNDRRGIGSFDPWLKAMLEASKDKPKVTTVDETVKAIREVQEKEEKEKPKVTPADWTPEDEWSRPADVRSRCSIKTDVTAATYNTSDKNYPNAPSRLTKFCGNRFFECEYCDLPEIDTANPLEVFNRIELLQNKRRESIGLKSSKDHDAVRMIGELYFQYLEPILQARREDMLRREKK